MGARAAWMLLASACGSPSTPALPDAGVTSDAAAVDGAPAVYTADPACSATPDAIYTAPAQLPADRGAVTACALGDKLDLATAQSELAASGAEGVTAQTGARIVKLAYRTVRSDGTAVISSATAYLPLEPRTVPVPIVLIGRPTAGIADSCAPSKEARPERNLALPFAARGFATITPDFSGLGTAGTHSYLDNHEGAAQLFDAALALHALVPAIGEPVAAVGYSQGGGVVLSAQGLELASTGKHSLKAVAAIAPEWPISTRSFGYEDVLREPDKLTALAGLATPAVTVLRHYAYFINKQNGNGGESFPADERASIAGSIESLCTVPLGGALDANQVRLGELVDASFRAQMIACIDRTAGCAGAARDFHTWLLGDVVAADPAGASVLIVQGLGDQVMPAADEAACDAAKLRTDGVTPALCVDTFATHGSILEAKIEHVQAWVEAAVTGAARPACSGSTLPACAR